jgi:argininosuccinate synthase
MAGIEILSELNRRAGRFGIGTRAYIGDCIVGIKGRIMFEAPGLFTLIEAHRKLEQLTLTKAQQAFLRQAAAQWAELVYAARYYDPLRLDLEALVDSAQRAVTGLVKVKLIPGRAEVVSYESPNALIDESIAVYAQRSQWTGEQANGFIRLYTLAQVIANKRNLDD